MTQKKELRSFGLLMAIFIIIIFGFGLPLLFEPEFITAIEYLVNIGIIVVQDDVNPISQSQLLPSWIKNTAGWWSQDSISDDEFVSSISFLINNGIIYSC